MQLLDSNTEILYLLPTTVILLASWVKFRGLEYVIINYRWIFVCLFLLPISVVYDSLYYIRTKIFFMLNAAPGKHDERVKKVQQQVSGYVR